MYRWKDGGSVDLCRVQAKVVVVIEDGGAVNLGAVQATTVVFVEGGGGGSCALEVVAVIVVLWSTIG